MAKGRFGGRSGGIKKHVMRPVEVKGLKFGKIQASIRYRGTVRLHLTGEDDDCLLTDHEWPENSGVLWYCCVASGLLFDKQTGECRQAQTVRLNLDTVIPFTANRKFYDQWSEARQKMPSQDWIRPLKDEEDADEYVALE